ncbi:LysR substrate-binding domain-containing protein [Streptococcus sp. DD13]|uniref:LysR substrate-binding domain-containing protein n=1 Tax=Streptococcus sp. DD13 TaxID=1777881 RepID=UPI0007957A33|nr:LysR substrate-binding domain-containing protein [Streptococcus sp. DD13]KXT78939.1 Malolactic regulator [Streptococcus sp. DD13]
MKRLNSHDEEFEIFRQAQLVQRGSWDLMQLLDKGDLDFSLIGSLEPYSHPHLTCQLLYQKEFYVIVSKRHPLANCKELSFKQLLEETFILLDEHHVHMAAFQRLNARYDQLAQSTVVLLDSNLVQRFIEENLGIGLMTDLTLFPEYPDLIKIPLVEEERMTFYISYAYPNETEPQPLIQSFIQRLEESI